MRRIHHMPFGTELLEDRTVRFRLWGPDCRTAELVLHDGAARHHLPMGRDHEGWWTVDADVPAGTGYRFRIDGDLEVPDPASRAQATDVHGASLVVDPRLYQWQDERWQGRPWEEAVVYELHVGTFSPEGTFAGVERRLDYLRDLGVTAIELMPLADFPGARNWGYDGVLPFAPDRRYGSPEELKSLVEAAHSRGLMVLLDVVYNHFGPEGNYLHRYAADFFTERHHTPWGAAINFDGAHSRHVRQFFVHNALYWLEEFHLDGLRLDAVHAICDDSSPDILEAIAGEVRARLPDRHLHLVLENDRNQAHYLRERSANTPLFDAQWNDDFHHAAHVALTGEEGGYYADFAASPLHLLGRTLAEGFAWQGQPSPFRDGRSRGEPSRDLPPTAFVNFLQNHDQVGNRAFGERLAELTPAPALRAATTVLLLAPQVPLLFQGQERGSRDPFLFFCDFEPGLAAAVTEGRRNEFAHFPDFSDPALRRQIPDPAAVETFKRSHIRWDASSVTEAWLSFHRELLAIRRKQIVPLVRLVRPGSARWQLFGEFGLAVEWLLTDDRRLILVANLGAEPVADYAPPEGELIYRSPDAGKPWADATLPAWSAAVHLSPRNASPWLNERAVAPTEGRHDR